MMRYIVPRLMSLMLGCLACATAQAGTDYALEASEIAPGVWVVEGSTENFSRENGGNIVNVAFLETGAGVVVIDTGPSKRYGEALRRLTEGTTREPITHVLLTHHHPDHVFGNQAFETDTLYMLDTARELMARDGERFAENMYRMVGDWMRGTEVVLPPNILEPGVMTVGNRRLNLLEFTGHTGSDLVVFDETSGVLFAADMLFYQRALTTPQSPGLDVWRNELEAIEALPYRQVVPGHGPVVDSDAAFRQMEDYLGWLDDTLSQAAAEGLSMNEVMRLPIPPRFGSISERQYELIRTATHLYSTYEKAVLK